MCKIGFKVYVSAQKTGRWGWEAYATIDERGRGYVHDISKCKNR